VLASKLPMKVRAMLRNVLEFFKLSPRQNQILPYAILLIVGILIGVLVTHYQVNPPVPKDRVSFEDVG